MVKYTILTFCFNAFLQNGKVIKVKDTIVILDSNNTQHTIRIAAIDCPEKSKLFRTKAKQFTSSEVFGEQVTIVKKNLDGLSRKFVPINVVTPMIGFTDY